VATSERTQTAQDFLEASDREFDAGENRQASEKLWGAATQIVIAMAEERGWDCGGHRAMKNASKRLAVEFEDQFIADGFSIAEKFHRNFYHNFMEDFELESDRPRVHELVERMLAYHHGELEKG
jgi:hypothetical protein